ncbi:hypothetical protein [Streptomyces sp. NBC_01361]|nr:hypothetical protein [Streptomyces sp. NBC_01361]
MAHSADRLHQALRAILTAEGYWMKDDDGGPVPTVLRPASPADL